MPSMGSGTAAAAAVAAFPRFEAVFFSAGIRRSVMWNDCVCASRSVREEKRREEGEDKGTEGKGRRNDAVK